MERLKGPGSATGEKGCVSGTDGISVLIVKILIAIFLLLPAIILFAEQKSGMQVEDVYNGACVVLESAKNLESKNDTQAAINVYAMADFRFNTVRKMDPSYKAREVAIYKKIIATRLELLNREQHLLNSRKALMSNVGELVGSAFFAVVAWLVVNRYIRNIEKDSVKKSSSGTRDFDY